MYPTVSEYGKHTLYKNSAFEIAIYERAMIPSLILEFRGSNWGFDYASIKSDGYNHCLEYKRKWHEKVRVEYLSAEQVNILFEINVFEEWMVDYYLGVLMSNRMRKVGGKYGG